MQLVMFFDNEGRFVSAWYEDEDDEDDEEEDEEE